MGHCPTCGGETETVFGVSIIAGRRLVKGDVVVDMSPSVATAFNFLRRSRRPRTFDEIMDELYAGTGVAPSREGTRSAIYKMRRDIGRVGLAAPNLTMGGKRDALYMVTAAASNAQLPARLPRLRSRAA